MPARQRGQLRQISTDPRIHPHHYNDERFPKSVGMGPMARKESKTHSRVPTAFDTRKLQSNIRSFSELSSTASLGIDCREDLDAVSFQKVRLRTADVVSSVRGKREGRRHDLVDRRKDFQKEGGKLGPLTRLTP